MPDRVLTAAAVAVLATLVFADGLAGLPAPSPRAAAVETGAVLR